MLEGLTDADNFAINWQQDMDVKVLIVLIFSLLVKKIFLYFRPKASVLPAVSSLIFWLLNLEEAEELCEVDADYESPIKNVCGSSLYIFQNISNKY